MNLTSLAEHGYLPDWLIRMGIRRLLADRLRQEAKSYTSVYERLRESPIAIATDAANEQHYEVPAEFFQTVLGARLKYSCCLFEHASSSLDEAEIAMLELTCRRAEIVDGMDVLELGCGWGSLTLWIAQKYPRCTVTAVSNSSTQRRFIEARCRALGLTNVRVHTLNIRDEWDLGTYDRVVSVEMFEHVRNYDTLLQRIARWLRPEGKLFVHIFCHREFAYAFETDGQNDWMAKHFFTGGMMPSFQLLRGYDRHLAVAEQWEVNGMHYAKTCEAWLQNCDRHSDQIVRIFERGNNPTDANLVVQRWRMFFMACAELFAYRGGCEWFVAHYLFEHQVVRVGQMLVTHENGGVR